MSTITTIEAVAIVDETITLITTLRAALKDARNALSPMVEDNKKLKAISEALKAEDEQVDAALSNLKARLTETPEPTPVDETPVKEVVVASEPVVEEPPVSDVESEDTAASDESTDSSSQEPTEENTKPDAGSDPA